MKTCVNFCPRDRLNLYHSSHSLLALVLPQMLISGGVSGILLGVITTFIGGVILIVSDKLSGGSGVAGAALASTAGNAVATPAAIAEIDKSIAASATIAMPQIAASTITTAILTPILVNFWVKRLQKKGLTRLSKREMGNV